jgi:hypothetical protein
VSVPQKLSGLTTETVPYIARIIHGSVIQNNGFSRESYVVEIDGKIRSAYGIFIEALKAGMELKQKFPHSEIKVHDADES